MNQVTHRDERWHRYLLIKGGEIATTLEEISPAVLDEAPCTERCQRHPE